MYGIALVNPLPSKPFPEPDSIQSEDELDELLTTPRDGLIRAIRQYHRPLVVLGASGKMGPSLCVLARRAAQAAGSELRVIAVSRFSDGRARDWLEARGVETLQMDLLDRRAFDQLPDSANVIYLVGQKFGTQQNPSLTWAVNTLVPSHVAERYPASRVVALSTGNVYPFVNPATLGAGEDHPPAPVGEYASAALARERIFEYYSIKHTTPMVLLRLNYAVELRYGVLVDIAQRIWNRQPLEVSAGYLNCIWQGDANDMILRSLELCSSPPAVYNLTGPAVLSVRTLAERLAELMERRVELAGSEEPTALLSRSERLCARLGTPPTPLDRVIEWTAQWIRKGGFTLGKPTHFEVRTGQY
jgi:nucleoside-diphosphate-sugar epimerase